ncbi:uncharacterized protein LOC123498372 isoform X2 [Portunus trituberculatus]|uniref:uncharacterized protein LOC123498372 isoform X2 n=1 Tax=Portunus trituberculatus TaxID=210409 RepID=UPI001E1CF60F|nr:uncharacterized protein LOC123498372 isoform X2 [Portunus trituberculatus]
MGKCRATPAGQMLNKSWVNFTPCDKRRGLGRGAILQIHNLPRPGAPRHYKPVSVEGEVGGAVPAIPGDCAVHHSWRYLSNAPVAYQMQQMLNAEEGWSGALSSFTQHTTTTTSATHASDATVADLPEKAPHDIVHGDGACSTKDNDGGNGLWEPWCPDTRFHSPPNVASTVEFPRLEHGSPAFRKNILVVGSCVFVTSVPAHQEHECLPWTLPSQQTHLVIATVQCSRLNCLDSLHQLDQALYCRQLQQWHPIGP